MAVGVEYRVQEFVSNVPGPPAAKLPFRRSFPCLSICAGDAHGRPVRLPFTGLQHPQAAFLDRELRRPACPCNGFQVCFRVPSCW